MTSKKYELDPNDTQVTDHGQTLYRIRALRDIGMAVKKGDLGGYIAAEDNLSHEGECWVFYSAQVSGSAKVLSDGWVAESAQACGHAVVTGTGKVSGTARLCGRVVVGGTVGGDAVVGGDVIVSKGAHVFEGALCGTFELGDGDYIG